jgi:iron transport multicopper oxidase
MKISFGVAPGTFTINGVTFKPPSVPVLLQILSGARTASELLPKGSVYLLPPNKVVEVSLPGGAPGSPVSCFLVFEPPSVFI